MARNERSPARAHAQRWVLTVAAVAMALGFGSVDAEGDRHKYCIVGAGPGGLQLGQLMLLARRDYVIYERNARPGSFFEKFPIHRKLISLNKRNTGRDNAEFNLRHDWNSLLGNPECLPVTNRTTDRFPHADTLVEYLRDFARPQETAGRIQYGVDVQLIARSDDGSGFTLDVRDAALQTERLAHCDVLIMANGLWTVNTPGIDGADLMTGYEELPSTGDSMEAKSIAIFGMGNSAFEVANAAADYANYVHIWPTRDKVWGWPHTSWESRYVGSLRGIRTGHLDGYLLKSLDGLPLGNTIVATPDRLMIKPCYGEQLCMFHLLPERPDVFILSFLNELDGEQAVALEALKKDTGIRVEVSPLPPGISQTLVDVLEEGGRTREHRLRMPGKALLVPREDLTNQTVTGAIMEWRRRTGDTLARPYDMVVRAMGWRHNTSIYADRSVRPRLQSQRKYPQMTPEYESINVPGMYFCGTLAHGKDWKRAAGGFIHGFRYTARALFHILETKYESRPVHSLWNAQEYSVPRDNQQIAERIMRRINEASGPYQMFYTLGDGMVLTPPPTGGGGGPSSSWTLTYLEEVPIDYFNARYAHHHRMMWLFGFDGQRRSLTESIRSGTGFEPSVWYWPPNVTTRSADSAVDMRSNGQERGPEKEIFRMIEHLHTDWSGDFFDFSLRRWLSAKLEAVIHGHGQAAGSRAGAGGRGHFDDHLGFDRPQHRSTAEFAVVEVDLTVMNMLKGKSSVVNLFRSAEPSTTVAKLKQREFHRLQSFDGESWIAEGRSDSGKLITRDTWVVSFSGGIVQERHVEDPVATVAAGMQDGIATAAGRMKEKPQARQPAPKYEEEFDPPVPLPPLAELENLKARELKELLSARGMDTKGKKATLLARLGAVPSMAARSPLDNFMGKDL